MRKALLIPLFGILALLVAILLLYSTVNTTRTQKVSSPTSIENPANLDSLISHIRRDRKYHIEGVAYDRIDSRMVVTIRGETASVRYFDTTYHLSKLYPIDGLIILNTNNRQLDAFSNRGARLLAAFKAQWCSEDECLPLTARIKQDFTVTTFIIPIKLRVEWFADSTFIVSDSFQVISAHGHSASKIVNAQIDMHGTILAYDTSR